MAHANGDLESGRPHGNSLHKLDSDVNGNSLTQTVTLSPEQFERIYLSPKGPIAGDLRKKFANPTPIAVMGFAVGLLPLSIEFSKCCNRSSARSVRLTGPTSGLERLRRHICDADNNLQYLVWRRTATSGWYWRVHSRKHVSMHRFLGIFGSFPDLCHHIHAVLQCSCLE